MKHRMYAVVFAAVLTAAAHMPVLQAQQTSAPASGVQPFATEVSASAPAAPVNARGSSPRLKPRPTYLLRAGDSIVLEYRYTPEFNQTVTIRPDGIVDLSLIGELKISDMTIQQVHDLILSRVESKLNTPELNIVLKDFEKPYVVVAGEVEHPGRLDFHEHTTALQAVLESGGFKDGARDTQVIIFRRVNSDIAEVHQLNLHKIQRTGDLERDMVLEPGDMLLVPRNKIEKLSRYIKALNIGLYLDPLQIQGLY